MFQFRRFPTYAYLIQRRLTEYCSAGFPHSEICGSKLMCSSPQLIAACHVLLRLLMPRHSPCALSSLTSSARSSTAPGPEKNLVLFKNYAGFSRVLWLNCIYPAPFRMRSTIKTYFPGFYSRPLCCLTLSLSRIFVQFSRCNLQPLLKSDMKPQPLC